MSEDSALQRRLEREKRKVRALEQMIEDQTRSLYLAHERLRRVVETLDGALFVTDAAGAIESANPAAEALLGWDDDSLAGTSLSELLDPSTLRDTTAGASVRKAEISLRGRDGTEIPVLFSATPLGAGEDQEGIVCIATDLRERRQLELELRHAQKLESIGQLAAGIAHEINTPIQFVGDSTHFLGEAYEDLHGVLEHYRALRQTVETRGEPGPILEKISDAEEEADTEFLAAEIPKAVRRTLDGIERVASIVRAMKEFAHPGDAEKAPADLNQAIETTLTVGRNEYKYIADVETDLGSIPLVICNVGDINQVILNLVVNAAHAIESRQGDSGERGQIWVRTRHSGDDVEIDVRDTGGGIPADVRERVFDPFFTTKEVGKGTGQGLAISRSVVVDRHGGDLRFEVEEGVGTTFVIRLPIEAPDGRD
ncbi:MAG: ATP-binding protein [Proteobacteria bacterium]|nr:ATP-binding protein [Pseudomonadota bacterium]